MKAIFRCFLGLMGLGVAGGALAQTPPAALGLGAGRWNVDYGQNRCSLARRMGGEQSPLMAFTIQIGEREPSLLIMQDRQERIPNLPRRVRVALGGASEMADVRPFARSGGRMTRLVGLQEGFLDRLAAAQAIELGEEGRAVTVRLPSAAAAVAALRACHLDMLRSFGVDPAVTSTFTRHPGLISGSIRNSDYPAQAVNQRLSGTVGTLLTIGTDGRPQNCRIIASSRVPLLDTTTCNIFMRRLQFNPALDANGQPVVGHFFQRVSWAIPEDDGEYLWFPGYAMSPGSNAVN